MATSLHRLLVLNTIGELLLHFVVGGLQLFIHYIFSKTIYKGCRSCKAPQKISVNGLWLGDGGAIGFRQPNPCTKAKLEY